MTRHGMVAVTFEELINAGNCWNDEELRAFGSMLNAAQVSGSRAAAGLGDLYAMGLGLLPVGRALALLPRSRLTNHARGLLGAALADAAAACGAVSIEVYLDDYATEPEGWLMPPGGIPRPRQQALSLIAEALAMGHRVDGLVLQPDAPDVLICDVGCRARRLTPLARHLLGQLPVR
ncbi:hypothetical protein [Deinococcus fonticola]|uniref:hypothetical protein n=1 Tax=Deinococcus fonticola TaxID=2528713 RepID=UPI001074D7DD|nr:hypothetical protein [Deinococcus fonticola]